MWSPGTGVFGRRPFFSTFTEVRWCRLFVFKDGEDAVGFAAAWWTDCTRISHGGGCRRRWRVQIRGRGCLGAWPWPMGVQRQLISFLGMSVYFGSSQSLHAMGLSRLWGWWCLAVAAPSGARWWSMQATRANTGIKGLFVISDFSRSLCANRFGQLSSVSYYVVPVFLQVFVRSP
jgi:hypothetical protein